ncbi:hypothetical protein GIB67_042919, partial [Kingdonia uniflora]
LIVSVVGNTLKQHELRDDVLQRSKGILASYGKICGRIPELLSVHFWFHIDAFKFFRQSLWSNFS